METDEPILRARDLMERDIISVTPDTTILDVHRLFVEEEIHGAPVIDENERVLGVITTLDLLRATRDELAPTASAYFQADPPVDNGEWRLISDELEDRMTQVRARDAMSRDIVMVDPDLPVDEVADVMLKQHIHRVLVGASGALQGVLTSFDMLRAASASRATTGARSRRRSSPHRDRSPRSR